MNLPAASDTSPEIKSSAQIWEEFRQGEISEGRVIPAAVIWQAFQQGKISLGHALHDIDRQHYGITNAEEGKRNAMMAQFVPDADKPRLFHEISGTIRKDAAHGNNYTNIVALGAALLSKDMRGEAYAIARDIILEKHNCEPDTAKMGKDVFTYAAVTALIEVARQLFPENKAREVLRSDLARLLDMGLARAGNFSDDRVLSDSGLAAELIVNFCGMAGYEDERLRVSNIPVPRHQWPSVYPVALKFAWSQASGFLVVIAGAVEYAAIHHSKIGRPGGPHQASHAFLAELTR